MEYDLKLKEEKLDIMKDWISRGKVAIRKDIYTRDFTITIPLQIEDLVIEKEVDGEKDILRIPISEEIVETVKSTKILNNVEIYRNHFTDIRHFEIDLKKEKLIVAEHFNEIN